jgi:hypothetical protein
MNFFARRFPVLRHRCAYLFFSLVGWMLFSPFLAETLFNQILEGLFNLATLVAAVVAVSRSRRAFAVSLMSAVLLSVLWYLALRTPGLGDNALAWGGTTVFYIFVLVHLMRYVLRAEVVSSDKLFGAASVYLMLAITWAGMYGMLQYFYSQPFAYLNQPGILDRSELVYFSFTTLTTAGFGDITPVLKQARVLAILEACTGVLYTAILIARLASEYPAVAKDK